MPLFPKDVAKLFAKNGLMGITLPEEDGQGGKLMDAVLAIEQVALVCPRSADVIQSGSFGPLRTFAEYATELQKEKYLSQKNTNFIKIKITSNSTTTNNKKEHNTKEFNK